jgi:hypothetical protein
LPNISPDFFTVFRVQPAIGRDFTTADAKKGAVPVALISYGYWKQYLGSSRDLSHLHLKIDNANFSCDRRTTAAISISSPMTRISGCFSRIQKHRLPEFSLDQVRLDLVSRM